MLRNSLLILPLLRSPPLLLCLLLQLFAALLLKLYLLEQFTSSWATFLLQVSGVSLPVNDLLPVAGVLLHIGRERVAAETLPALARVTLVLLSTCQSD